MIQIANWIKNFFLGVLLLVPSQNPQGTVIEGQVLQADVTDRVPIENARIELQSGPRDSIYARTDASGRFRLSDVQPGQYQLTVMASGYVATEYGQRAIGQPGAKLSVAPGMPIAPLLLKLGRAATITGHIQDDENLPLANVPVQALQATYATDGKRVLTPITFTRTNDLGEYRLYWLTPGEYYVSASPSAGRNGPAFTPLNPNLLSSRTGYPAWLYPGVPDLLHALPVRLTSGELRDGIDFRFMPMSTVNLSGTVIDQRTGNGTAAQLSLGEQSDVRGGSVLQALSDASGTFQFRGVASGTYTLRASSVADNAQGTKTIDVTDKDFTNLNIVLETGISIRGRIAPDPEDPTLTLPQLTVALIPGGSAQTQNDHTFEIKNVRSCSCTVAVIGLTVGLYIKSAQFGRSNAMTDSLPDFGEIRPTLSTNGVLAPITPGQIIVSSDSKDSLDIVISAASGRIKGTVADASGAPFPAARVVLVPEEKFRGIRPYYQVTTSDQTGAFSIRGIRPGSYSLYAWETVENGAYYNRDFMRPFEGRGIPIEIEPEVESIGRVQVIDN